MKQIYEMKGAGHSARAIARELGLARNTALRYLKTPEAIRPKARPRRGSKLHAYAEHIDRPMGESLENCAVLLGDIRHKRRYQTGIHRFERQNLEADT